MTQDNKDTLLNSFERPSRDEIRKSQMVDKLTLKLEMVDKWSIKPSLAEKMVDILEYAANKGDFTTEQIVSHFGFNATTTKRYLR